MGAVPKEPSTPPPRAFVPEAKAKPAAPPTPSRGKGASEPARLRSLEVMLNRLLHDWSTLPEDLKPQAMQLLLDRRFWRKRRKSRSSTP
ncbi:unnamed protein product [Effrenium voratum]|nr:unnamed protein product [Effrenium voratum]